MDTRSRDSKGRRYRWLIFQADGPRRRLSGFEYEEVKRHLRQTRTSNEEVYVVVRFRVPESKLIVVPAKRVVKKNRILPLKGGIPWFV